MKFNWFPLYHNTEVQYQKPETTSCKKITGNCLMLVWKPEHIKRWSEKNGTGDWVKGIFPMEVCSVECFLLLTVMFCWGYCCLLTYSMLRSFFSTLQLYLNFFMYWVFYICWMFFVLLPLNFFCPVLKVGFLWPVISSCWIACRLEASDTILCLCFQGLCCHAMPLLFYAACFSGVIGNPFPME